MRLLLLQYYPIKYKQERNYIMNIVLIDDDQLVCMSLKMILEADDNIQVTAIGHDGNDALPLYRPEFFFSLPL